MIWQVLCYLFPNVTDSSRFVTHILTEVDA